MRGVRVLLRDWRVDDDEPLRAFLHPDRTWHDTNGPYFGRPAAEEMDAHRHRLMDLAATPPAALPTPRQSPAVESIALGRLVGTVTWYWEDERTDWRRMGVIVYDDDARGHGLGREALSLWTSYLFDSTDALRLDLATYSGNAAMIAVARRLGFIEEARLRKARRWAGGIDDSLVFGILREEWAGPT